MTVTGKTRHGALRVRLKVSNVQAQSLLSAAGARRYAFNWAVGRIVANQAQWHAEATYGVDKRDRTKPFSYFDLVREWDANKAQAAPWHPEHSTWTFRYAIRAATEGHARFMAGKSGFPRFKGKHRDKPRFTTAGALQLEPGRLRIPKYGWFRIAAPCPAQAKLRRLLRRGRARLMNLTVVRRSDGHWYATLCYEQFLRPNKQELQPGPAVGVDVGIASAAVAARADGTLVGKLAGSRALRDSLPRIKRLQRRVARAQKGSMNRRKAVARLAKAHAAVAAGRNNSLHTFTASLARSQAAIAVEDLAIAGMLQNRHLAAAIADQGWGELRRQLHYKAERHGGLVVVVDRWFPSTKTCSSCGTVKAKLPLAVRTYSCDSCDLVIDRDINAAANLAAWAESHLRVTARAGDRHPGGPSAENTRQACGGDNERTDPVGHFAGVSGEAGTSQPAAV